VVYECKHSPSCFGNTSIHNIEHIKVLPNDVTLPTLISSKHYNIRILICEALIRLNWRNLTSKLFEVCVDCDEDGNIVTSNTDIGKIYEYEDSFLQTNQNIDIILNLIEQRSLSSEIRDIMDLDSWKNKTLVSEALKVNITNYERIGYIYGSIGITINILWIVPLMYLETNMDYKGINYIID